MRFAPPFGKPSRSAHIRSRFVPCAQPEGIVVRPTPGPSSVGGTLASALRVLRSRHPEGSSAPFHSVPAAFARLHEHRDAYLGPMFDPWKARRQRMDAKMDQWMAGGQSRWARLRHAGAGYKLAWNRQERKARHRLHRD